VIRLYREHPEFGELTSFDPTTGRLDSLTAEQYQKLVKGCSTATTGIRRLETGECTVFTGETPATRTRFPRRIYFQITRSCNLCCSYCYIRANRDQPHVPLAAALEMAAFLGHKGLMEVRLTGGEPTNHPDFLEILDAFLAAGVYVSVSTNGMVSRDTLDGLANRENTWVICSVDGNRDTHNRYRPGSFDTIMKNLSYLRNRNPKLRLRLTTVLTRHNKNQVRDLGEMTRSLGAESLTIIPLRPQVRDAAARQEMVTATELRQVIEDMVQVMDELGVRMTTTLATDLEDRIHKDPVVRKRSSCAAGREATNLDYDARQGRFLLYGCSYSPASDLDADPAIRAPFLAGSFATDRIADLLPIWRDDKRWAIYRDSAFKSPECLGCEYYIRHQCVGSCPIQNVDYASIDASEDVLAQLKVQLEQTGEWYCYNLK
jgi:MoaA/NifB/PqqE/SkfB family radical SAM enzyme